MLQVLNDFARHAVDFYLLQVINHSAPRRVSIVGRSLLHVEQWVDLAGALQHERGVLPCVPVDPLVRACVSVVLLHDAQVDEVSLVADVDFAWH